MLSVKNERSGIIQTLKNPKYRRDSGADEYFVNDEDCDLLQIPNEEGEKAGIAVIPLTNDSTLYTQDLLSNIGGSSAAAVTNGLIN